MYWPYLLILGFQMKRDIFLFLTIFSLQSCIFPNMFKKLDTSDCGSLCAPSPLIKNIPPVISSNIQEAILRVGAAMEPIIVTSSERLTDCQMAPKIEGSVLDPQSCTITGVPRGITAASGVKVTLTGTSASGKSNSIELNIKVYKRYCDGLGADGRNMNMEPLNDGSTIDNPIILCGRQGMEFLKNNATSGKYFKLQSSVDLFGFTPGVVFSGHLDGAGHGLYNLYLKGNGLDNNGLFQSIDNSEFKNLIIDSFGLSNSKNVGLISGVVLSSANVLAENIIIRKSSIGWSYPSGLMFGVSEKSNTTNLFPNISLRNILIHDLIGSSIGTNLFVNGPFISENIIYEDSSVTSLGYVTDYSGGSKTRSELLSSAIYNIFPADTWSGPTTLKPSSLIEKKDRVYTDGVEAAQ